MTAKTMDSRWKKQRTDLNKAKWDREENKCYEKHWCDKRDDSDCADHTYDGVQRHGDCAGDYCVHYKYVTRKPIYNSPYWGAIEEHKRGMNDAYREQVVQPIGC